MTTLTERVVCDADGLFQSVAAAIDAETGGPCAIPHSFLRAGYNGAADPGDLIIEYVGELVRASAANIRNGSMKGNTRVTG